MRLKAIMINRLYHVSDDDSTKELMNRMVNTKVTKKDNCKTCGDEKDEDGCAKKTSCERLKSC